MDYSPGDAANEHVPRAENVGRPAVATASDPSAGTALMWPSYWGRYRARWKYTALACGLLGGLYAPVPGALLFDIAVGTIGNALLLGSIVNLIVAAFPAKARTAGDKRSGRQAARPQVELNPRVRRPGNRLGRRGVVALGLVLVVVVVAADRLIARAEMDTLLTNVKVSEAAMNDFQNWERNPQLPSVAQSDLAALTAAITSHCQQAAVAVRVAQGPIAASSFWHPSIGRAQAAYVAHSQAWADYLSACSSSAEAFIDKKYSVEISSTFQLAKPIFERAVPWPAADRQTAMVDAIFAS